MAIVKRHHACAVSNAYIYMYDMLWILLATYSLWVPKQCRIVWATCMSIWVPLHPLCPPIKHLAKERVKSRVIYHTHIFLSMGGEVEHLLSSILKVEHLLTLSSQLYILGRCYSGKDSSSILFSIQRIQKKMHIMSTCLALALMCYIYCFLLGEHLQISDLPWVGIIFCIPWDLPPE